MSPKKNKKILTELFSSQNEMAQTLGVSQAKVSDAMTGKSGFSAEIIGKLICDYNIDAAWMFLADDNEPLRFKEVHVNDSKYIMVLERNQELHEDLIACHIKIKELTH
jgi:plasmid maintenance system antidote protein VapI